MTECNKIMDNNINAKIQHHINTKNTNLNICTWLKHSENCSSGNYHLKSTITKTECYIQVTYIILSMVQSTDTHKMCINHNKLTGRNERTKRRNMNIHIILDKQMLFSRQHSTSQNHIYIFEINC